MQLPRLYNIYKSMGIVTSFQNILDNVFIPLFEVTVDPNSHPQLHMFLMQVSCFIHSNYYFLNEEMMWYALWFRARGDTHIFMFMHTQKDMYVDASIGHVHM